MDRLMKIRTLKSDSQRYVRDVRESSWTDYQQMEEVTDRVGDPIMNMSLSAKDLSPLNGTFNDVRKTPLARGDVEWIGVGGEGAEQIPDFEQSLPAPQGSSTSSLRVD